MSAKQSGAGVLIVLGTVVTAVANWLLVWFFARIGGGAEVVGAYSTILAIASPVFVISQLGLRTIVLSSRNKWPWKTYWIIRWIGISLGSIGLIGFFYISTEIDLGLGIAVTALKVFDSLLDLQLGAVQYNNNLRLLGILMICNASFSIFFAAIGIWLTGSPETAIWISALTSAFVTLWTFIKTRDSNYKSNLPPGSGSRSILRSGVPVTVSQFLSTFLFQIPILFVATVSEKNTVGVFAASAYLLTFANVIGGTLQTVLMSSFRTKLELEGMANLRDHCKRIAWRTSLGGMFVGILIIVSGDFILAFIYGNNFRIGPIVLSLLVIGAICTCTSFVFSVTLTVLNLYKQTMIAIAISCGACLLIGAAYTFGSTDTLVIASSMVAAGAIVRLVVTMLLVKSARITREV